MTSPVRSKVETTQQNARTARATKRTSSSRRAAASRGSRAHISSGDLLDGVEAFAHDCRGTLQAIKFCAHSLGTHATTGDISKDLRDCAYEISTKLDAFRQYCGIGAQACAPQWVDVRELCAKVLPRLRAQYGNAHHVEILATPPVYGDPEQLALAVGAILDNAMKFSVHSRHPSVTVEGHRSKSSVRVSFRDNGIGIDPAVQPRLFRLFKRAHQDSRFVGIGAGLALSRRIIEAQSGTLELVRSGDGETVFCISLPIVE